VVIPISDRPADQAPTLAQIAVLAQHYADGYSMTYQPGQPLMLWEDWSLNDRDDFWDSAQNDYGVPVEQRTGAPDDLTSRDIVAMDLGAFADTPARRAAASTPPPS